MDTETLKPGDFVEYREYLRSFFPGLSDGSCVKWMKEGNIKRIRGDRHKVYALKSDLDKMLRDKVDNAKAGHGPYGPRKKK